MNEVESFFQIRIFQNAFKKLDVNRLSKHCPITSYEMTKGTSELYVLCGLNQTDD